ncbi:MAG: SLC13 family permease [bacterium]|nr:SLC13 family permease [bacterium]
MDNIKEFIKREAVLCAAFTAALASCCFVPPQAGYLAYFDLRTLALLYCLMVVVSGLCQAGLFSWMAHSLCLHAKNSRTIGFILVALSFFSSMFITNDVALLTFVPFALVVLGLAHCERELIIVIVLQTVAANLGSMLTPVGNPQNLYLHSYYTISNAQFFATTLPVWLVSLASLLILCLIVPKHPIRSEQKAPSVLQKRELLLYSLLFAVCLLVIFRVLSWYCMTGIVLIVLALHDRCMLAKADFMLLLTFVCFFVFAGNLAHIETINNALCQLLEGRVYLIGLLASQVISNVPAALLLSGFTQDAQALLLGVDIGGLGTPIASLASLISLKLYAASANSHTWRFLGVFSLVNFFLLAMLSFMFGC